MAFVQTRVDDIDGSTDNVEPVVIGWNGHLWTLDVSEGNRVHLDEVLSVFIKKARLFGDLPKAPNDPQNNGVYHVQDEDNRAPQKTIRKRKQSAKTTTKPRATPEAAARNLKSVPAPVKPALLVPPSAQEIRAWGNANGYSVSPTGQIPRAVKNAYEDAHR